MAHLAARSGRAFAVEVEVGAGFRQGGLPRIVADQVFEADLAPRQRRGAQGEAADGADVVFELRGVGALDRPMAGIVDAGGHFVEHRTVAVWGLTFKAGTDDLRDSPALAVVGLLVAAGAEVRAYDPTVGVGGSDPADSVGIFGDPLSPCDGSHVLVVLTDWDEFRKIEPVEVAERMANRAVVDARNSLDRQVWQRAGFDFQSIGS